eukprot:gene35162-45528_t
MNGPIPPSVHRTAILSPEFPILWMRTLRLSLKMIAQLKMSSGMSIGRSMTDGRIDKNA